MKKTSVLLLAFVLTGLAPVCTPWSAQAAVLQSFDRLFQGDDPTESFPFSLSPNPAVPTTLRFAGFVENRDSFAETGVRFYLGWKATAGGAETNLSFPPVPDFFMGVRLPSVHPVSGAVRVPVEFQAEIGFSPAWVRMTVEGLGGNDNFRLVGDFTIQPEPRLRVSRVGTAVAQITWTTNSAGYRLEYATALPASVWSAATNTVSVAGGNFSVTVGTATAQRVYRLRKP